VDSIAIAAERQKVIEATKIQIKIEMEIEIEMNIKITIIAIIKASKTVKE